MQYVKGASPPSLGHLIQSPSLVFEQCSLLLTVLESLRLI
jgi:hypothetical protein